jgi:hypothetical protein
MVIFKALLSIWTGPRFGSEATPKNSPSRDVRRNVRRSAPHALALAQIYRATGLCRILAIFDRHQPVAAQTRANPPGAVVFVRANRPTSAAHARAAAPAAAYRGLDGPVETSRPKPAPNDGATGATGAERGTGEGLDERPSSLPKTRLTVDIIYIVVDKT